MRDSAFRRPLVWLLAAYMAALARLHHRGAFVPALPDQDRPLHRSEADVVLVEEGPAREDSRGWKSEAEGEEAFGAPLPYRLLVRWPPGRALDELPLPGD